MVTTADCDDCHHLLENYNNERARMKPTLTLLEYIRLLTIEHEAEKHPRRRKSLTAHMNYEGES